MLSTHEYLTIRKPTNTLHLIIFQLNNVESGQHINKISGNEVEEDDDITQDSDNINDKIEKDEDIARHNHAAVINIDLGNMHENVGEQIDSNFLKFHNRCFTFKTQ